MNMKKNLYLLLFLISLFIVPYSVNAEDVISCDYGSSGLKFEYSGSNPKPKIISDFVSGKKYFHLLTLIESGQDQTVTEHIDMDQKWYALYHETPCACPTKLYVCTSTEYSINFPTLKGSLFAGIVQFLEILDGIAKDIDNFGAGLNVVLKGISAGINFVFGSNVNLTVGEWDLSSIITEELIADVGENAYALFTVNDRHLYILTEDEYKKSDFSGKKTGFYSDRGEYFMSNKDVVCKLGNCSIWIIDFLTDKLANAKTDLDLLIDLFTEDQIVLGGYREISCKTVEYSGECDTFDVNCDFFTRDEVEYKKLVKKYKDCNSDSTCKTSLLMDIHELEAVMDEKCKIVLKNYLYSDGMCKKLC